MRLDPRDRPADMLTATSAPLGSGTKRPDQTGCVEWVLACSKQEITTGAGMPRAMVRELAALLERWHGTQSSGIARSAAVAVAELIAAGGGGRLRLSGTRGQLLVEVIGMGPQPATRTDRAAPDVSAGTTGSYRTFAETRSEHVRWVGLPLPARQHESAAMPGHAGDDGWI